MEQPQEQPNSESTNLNVCTIENKITITSSKIPEHIDTPVVSGDDLSYKNILFFKSPTIISINNHSVRPKVHFKMLLVSGKSVFENLDISGTIQVPSHSEVIFRNCNIHNLGKTECAVKINDYSSGIFENCSLDNYSKQCCVIISKGFSACFNNCTLDHSNGTGISVMDSSNVTALDCNFSKCSDVAIFSSEKSKVVLQKCTFQNMSGIPITAQYDSNVEVLECNFNTCDYTRHFHIDYCGAISIYESSNFKAINCNFQNIKGNAICLRKDCGTEIFNCTFNQITNGNGVKIDISSGKVTNCTFNSFNAPAIVVSGKNSNPTIKNCTIRNISKFSFIDIRNGAAPIFEDIHIGGFTSETPVILCSDFSVSVFKGLNFEISEQTPQMPEMMVCNAAKVKVVPSPNCKVECVHEDEKKDEFSNDDSKYCLRILERTSSQAMILQPTDEHIPPEFIDIKNVKQYKHPDVKVISCLCGHTITSCPRCGNHDYDVFTFDGVNLMCKNCGILNFNDNAFKCSICKYPIKKILRPFDNNDTCVICLGNSPNTIFLPCGHKCICYKCAHQYSHNCKPICPSCQQICSSFRYDFFTSEPKHK